MRRGRIDWGRSNGGGSDRGCLVGWREAISGFAGVLGFTDMVPADSYCSAMRFLKCGALDLCKFEVS